MPTIIEGFASHNQDLAHLAYDREPNTRWTSGVPMEPTMTFMVKLDKASLISGISATTPEATDVPADWTIAVMDSDGGHGYREVAKGHGQIVASWPPEVATWVKIRCDSADPFYWWSLTEVMVDAEELPPVEPPPVVPPVVPDPAVTDTGWRTWPEELCRQVVEGMADRFGWERKYREGVDFTIGKYVVREAIIYVGQQKSGEGYDPWPFENTPIGG